MASAVGAPAVTSSLALSPGAPIEGPVPENRFAVSGRGERAAAPSVPAAAAVASPTPAPADPRFVAAEEAVTDGDLAQAQSLLQELAQSPDVVTAARATFRLGRALLQASDRQPARQVLESYRARFPNGADAASVNFILAELPAQPDNASQTASEFQRYLGLTTDHRLDGYAYDALGHLAEAAGQSATAIANYRRAVLAGLPGDEEMTAAISVGHDLLQKGAVADAAAWYGQVADRPGLDDATHAHYQTLQANALRRVGQTARAADLYRSVLLEKASPGDPGAAIAALRASGTEVDPLQAAQAFLRSGEYGQAARTLEEYITNPPSEADVPTARLERGRALLFGQQYDDAIAQLAKFQSEYPTEPRLGEAALLIGKAKLATTGAADAASYLESFATGHPTDANSAQALSDAISDLKASSNPADALSLDQELIATFPQSPLAAQAAFDLGWAHYEALDAFAATSQWTAVQDRWSSSPSSPAALLWLGKIRAGAGDAAGARRAFDLAWQANPGDFYAFRARELAQGSTAAAATPLVTPSPAQLAKERADLDRWLAGWTKPSVADQDRPYLGAPVARTSTLDRIAALAALGLKDQADRELTQATHAYADDGRSLFALADRAASAGLTAESADVAYQLLLLSPSPNAYQAPRYLQRLVYPFPYQTLIEAAAAKYGVDPLLLVALIRQESRFDPRAHSNASAMGLTQMMPSTAQTIAARVGMKNFTPGDLDEPRVAIELGAAYLAAEVQQNGGNPYLALAAYNAGDGQVLNWLGDNPHHDFDLLVEEIPYAETRDYVRNVYRFYQEYELLYRGAE